MLKKQLLLLTYLLTLTSLLYCVDYQDLQEAKSELNTEELKSQDINYELQENQDKLNELSKEVSEKAKEHANLPWGSEQALQVQKEMEQLGNQQREVMKNIDSLKQDKQQSIDKQEELKKKVDLIEQELRGEYSPGTEPTNAPEKVPTAFQKVQKFFSDIWDSVKNVFSRQQFSQSKALQQARNSFTASQQDLTTFEQDPSNLLIPTSEEVLTAEMLDSMRKKAKPGTSYYTLVKNYDTAKNNYINQFQKSPQIQKLIDTYIKEIPDYLSGLSKDDLSRIQYTQGFILPDQANAQKDQIYKDFYGSDNPYSQLEISYLKSPLVSREDIYNTFNQVSNPSPSQVAARNELRINKEYIDNNIEMVETTFNLIYKDPKFVNAMNKEITNQLQKK